MNYYQLTHSLWWYLSLNISEVESWLPYELDIRVSLIHNSIEEDKKQQ